MRVRLGAATRQPHCHHRSGNRARLYYSQSDVIAILAKLDRLGLSDNELESMKDMTLEEIDRMVNTVKNGEG